MGWTPPGSHLHWAAPHRAALAQVASVWAALSVVPRTVGADSYGQPATKAMTYGLAGLAGTGAPGAGAGPTPDRSPHGSQRQDGPWQGR